MDTILMRVAEAMENADPYAFAACFSEDATYSDYCPSSNGCNNWFCYGAAGIEMFFIHMMLDGRFKAFSSKKEDENRMSFFGIYDGPFVFAMFEIKELDENGLIRKAVVYPT